jgi:hypothetical protein
MKKLLLILSIVFMLLACGDSGFFTNNYDVYINNKSTKTISYTFNGSPDSVLAGEKKTYTVSGSTFDSDIAILENVKDENGLMSVNIDNKAAQSFIFTNADLYNLNVANKLPIAIEIKSENRINNNGSNTLIINANDTDTAKIYMPIEKITALTNYPIIIDRNISGNTVYVVLR